MSSSSEPITTLPAHRVDLQKDGTSTLSKWEKTVDISGPVKSIDVVLSFTDGIANAISTHDEIVPGTAGNSIQTLDDFMAKIENIHIKPTGRETAVNISGKMAAELMKGKYPGKCFKTTILRNDADDADIEVVSAVALKFDFTDYMKKMDLALPASAKSVNIKIEFNSDLKIVLKEKDGGSGTQNVFPELTVRVVQDMNISSRGYRTYFEQEYPISGYDNKTLKDIKFLQKGFLDSFIIDNRDPDDPTKIPDIKDIELVVDDHQYPLITTAELEQMSAQLYNDELFNNTSIYCDLAGPILAAKANSLKLYLKFGSLNSAEALKIMFEYIVQI